MVLDELVGGSASQITNFMIIIGFISLVGKVVDRHFQKKLEDQSQEHEDDMKHLCGQFQDLKDEYKKLENIVLQYIVGGKSL